MSDSADVLLLSGGVDSTAVAAWRRPQHALMIDYGQRPAAAEGRAAKTVADRLGIPFSVLRADCAAVGGGLLHDDDPLRAAPSPEWWPYRNQLLVTLAAAWAVRHGFTEILVGTVLSDGERHVDGRRDFYEALDNLVRMQEGNLRVTAPAIELSSEELVRRAGVDRSLMGWTVSCHTGDVACGTCPGCVKRANVLDRAGLM